ADLGAGAEHVHTGHLLLGTLPYLAPEQAADPPVSSPASDWYSAGVMLYQALTGRLPFTGSVLQVVRDKQAIDPPSPRSLAPDVPEALDGLCTALLRRQPSERPSAGEVLSRLSRPPAAPVTGGQDVPLMGRAGPLHFLEG